MLLRYTPDAESLVAQAAKLCYSDASLEDIAKKIDAPEDIEKFLEMLDSLGHESPTEHASYTFGIENISRITEVQLVRKRIASYSVKSGRYVKRNNPNFIIPPAIQNSPLALQEFEKARIASVEAYNSIFLILMLTQMGLTEEEIECMDEDTRIEAVAEFHELKRKQYSRFEKIAIEDARYAHMQSLATTLIVTMNTSSLKGFFKARCCRRAQWEIRQMAMLMLEEVQEVSPNLFRRAGAGCVRGKCPEGKMSCGNPYPLIEKKKVMKSA